MRRRTCELGLILAGCVTAAHGNPVTFDHFIDGEEAFGNVTSFTDTVSGVAATFSSPPGGFEVGPTFFSFGPEVLLDSGLPGDSNISLKVAFSSPVAIVGLSFATDGPGTFDLAAYLGGTLVGSASAVGKVPSGFFFPEGHIGFRGTPFDSIVLSSPSTPAFAVENFEVDPAPEPSACVLLATVAVACTIFLRRRKRAIGA